MFDLDPTQPEPEFEAHLLNIHPEDRDKFTAPVNNAIEKGESWSVEYRNILADGRSRYLLGRGRAVRDFNGNICALSGTVQDITERKADEAILTQAKLSAERSDRMKSLFLANMSHEIRTPLNGVIGAAKILSKGSLNERQQECVEMISRCGNSLLTIINDVLDLASIEAGKIKLDKVAFDLRAEIESVVLLLADKAIKKGLEFASQIDVPVPSFLLGDPGRLKQIISNLLGNAIKFTDSGDVVLKVVMQELSSSRVKLSFKIKDTGIGIPLEKQDRLFKAFSQADDSMSKRYQGTGLGLSICKNLTELMGGEIGFTSSFGEGAEFYFTACLEREAFQRKIPARKLSALLVSNRRHMRRAMALQLQYLSCRCVEVTTADAALQELSVASLANEFYSLLIIDGQAAGNFEPLLKRSAGREQLVLVTTDENVLQYPAFLGVKFNAVLNYPIRDSAWLGLFENIPVVSLVSDNKKLLTSEKWILVVDDNETDSRLLELFLIDNGYLVECVPSGYAALEAVKLRNFELIFMDLQMSGINGVEAARIIRQSEPPDVRIPIIALTTLANEGGREMCLEAGMDDYLNKPLDEKNLNSVIKRWISRGNKSYRHFSRS